MTQYSHILQEFQNFLLNLKNGNPEVKISLDDLSKLQAVKVLINDLSFINEFYGPIKKEKNPNDFPQPQQKIYLKNDEDEKDNFILVLNNNNRNSVNEDDLFNYHMDYFVNKFKVTHPPTKADLRKMILKYEKENSNPLSKVISEMKNPNQKDLHFLKEYFQKDISIWVQLLTSKKKPEQIGDKIKAARISQSVANRLIGPELIGELTFEKNEKINSTIKNSISIYNKRNTDDSLTSSISNENVLFDKKEFQNLLDWEYDVLNENSESKKFNNIWMMFHSLSFLKDYSIQSERFFEFLYILREKYNQHNNSFHNFDHGFTVMHCSFYLIYKKILPNFLENIDLFSLLLSSLCHDVDHTGKTNAFEVSSFSELAIRYNDESVLENHHVSQTYLILSNSKYNILENVSEQDYKLIRKRMISNILHTDIKKHFDLIKDFEFQLKDSNEVANLNDPKEKEEKKLLLSGTVIHSMDLYTSTKNYPTYKKWSIKINNEFTQQVKEEERLEIPITTYMKDLDKNDILAKAELGFIRFIQKPLWKVLNEFLGNSLQVQMENIENNIKEWEKLLQ